MSENGTLTPAPTIHWQRHLALALLLTAMVATGDFYTGWELGFGTFYLIPVIYAAWFQTRLNTAVTIVLSTILWALMDLGSGHTYTYPVYLYWNAAVRFGTFALCGYGFIRMRELRQGQQDLIQYIVHDLRNPLFAIRGHMELQQMSSLCQTDKQVKDRTEECLSSLSRMNMMIDSILDVSRLENDKMPFDPEVINVIDLIEAVAMDALVVAKRRKVDIKTDVAREAAVVFGDMNLTRRVLNNLITNAVRVAPPDTVVTIRALREDKQNVLFSVEDQGPGIPRQHLRAVFSKFVQLDAKVNPMLKGSGLGLAFCRLATEYQGGKIWMESDLGKGTKVKFTVPIPKGMDTKAG